MIEVRLQSWIPTRFIITQGEDRARSRYFVSRDNQERGSMVSDRSRSAARMLSEYRAGGTSVSRKQNTEGTALYLFDIIERL